MKKIYTTLIFSIFTFCLLAQAPKSFKYQTVIRDGSGVVLANHIVSIKTSIVQGTPNGTEVYSEKHPVTTNDFGVVTLNIGQGEVLSGSFNQINWASSPYFIKIEIDLNGGNNFLFMGTSEMLSVPYALYAERSNISNADTSATNELQTLTRNGLEITLSQNGGTVNIADNDNDSMNEIQQISKIGNTINLSRNGGNVTDNDNQTLSLQGNQLVISNGNSLTITSIVDLDSDPTNEIQTLSYFNDTLKLSRNGGDIIMPSVPHGSAIGEMLYWNGSSWITVPSGSYGQTLVFCNGVPSWTGCVPVLSTATVTGITNDIAVSGGIVTNDGGRNVIYRGVCWNTNPNPTIANNHTTDGSGIGAFTSNLTGLNTLTTYYVRAYATNSAGTGYGNELNFITLMLAPTISTVLVSSITGTTVVSGGNITNDGGATVTQRGVCWNTASNPTITNNHTTDGIGTGTFVSNITGLSLNTTYYVMSYATNSIGTSYGNEIMFTTKNTPTVTTTNISNLTNNSVSTGGSITSDGGLSITARGVCWNTATNPTITNSHTSDGTGTGIFTSNITGLVPTTTYYMRAYAANSAGTAYGNEISFIAIAIGTSYQGGIVAYILQPGDPGYVAGQQHGLIAAASDQSSGIHWCSTCDGGNFTATGATATALGTGNANTTTIILSQGAGSYAAKLCDNLVMGGYNDWYLPSKDELSLLYTYKVAIGGFVGTYYWSSSEIDSQKAWERDFPSGMQIEEYKGTAVDRSVRAIRSF